MRRQVVAQVARTPTSAKRNSPKGGVLIWDFLQRYDESWIWRCADRRHVTESARNFAALEECIEDAVRHGYAPAKASARQQAAQASHRRTRRAKTQLT